MNSVCIPAAPVPTRRAPLQRWVQDLTDELQRLGARWQAYRREQAKQKTLRALSAATLRDIGMEHAVPPPVQGPSWAEYERARW